MHSLITLLLGFSLGIKHAFEADHVIAVSTIVSEQKNPLKSALIGTFWGIGHTSTLFLIGIIVLIFKVSVPENLSQSLEFLVGIMLVFLGILTILKAKRITIAEKEHIEAHTKHKHHVHHRSFLVGSVHGLAGSGALMLLVLSTVSSTIEGVYYILLFGLGSVLGMSIMSVLIGLPFIVSIKTFPSIEKHLRLAAGIISILFGLDYMYQVEIVDGLFR